MSQLMPQREVGSKLRIVTTSWDDGGPTDLRIAELLHNRALRGTFYVPLSNLGHSVLDKAGLRLLTKNGFEVGGHGLSHRILPDLPVEEIDREVGICKQMLEEILGREVSMFCYPRGRHNRYVQQSVKKAGYQGARTTQMLAVRLAFGQFEMPTSVQAYPHVKLTYVKNLAKRGMIRGLHEYIAHFSRLDSWVEIGRKLFDLVLLEGGVWHLYGHSWEIEQLGIWDDLREILDYVCKRDGVTYLSNREVIDFVPVNSAIGRQNLGISQK